MKSNHNPLVNMFLFVMGICFIFLLLYFAKLHAIKLLGGKVININEIAPSPVNIKSPLPTIATYN